MMVLGTKCSSTSQSQRSSAHVVQQYFKYCNMQFHVAIVLVLHPGTARRGSAPKARRQLQPIALAACQM